MIECKEILWDSIKHYQKPAEKDGILFSSNSDYYGFYIDGEFFGFGAVLYKGQDATSKSDWIFPEYRRKGLYLKVYPMKKQMAFDRGIRYLHGHCTEMSIGAHVQMGADVIKVYKNGITKIRYENLS